MQSLSWNKAVWRKYLSHIEVLLNKLVYCAPLFDYADKIIPLYAITAMSINAMIHNNILSLMIAGYSNG